MGTQYVTVDQIHQAFPNLSPEEASNMASQLNAAGAQDTSTTPSQPSTAEQVAGTIAAPAGTALGIWGGSKLAGVGSPSAQATTNATVTTPGPTDLGSIGPSAISATVPGVPTGISATVPNYAGNMAAQASAYPGGPNGAILAADPGIAPGAATTAPTAAASTTFPFIPVAAGAAGIAHAAGTNAAYKTANNEWDTAIGATNAPNPLITAPTTLHAIQAAKSGEPLSDRDRAVLLRATRMTPGLQPLAAAILMYNTLFAGGQGIFGSSKGKEQLQRDAIRKAFREQGFLNPDNTISFSNGDTFDIGKDAGAMLQNEGTNIDQQTQRHYFDVDFSSKKDTEGIGALAPLVNAIVGGDMKTTKDFTGYFVNATGGDPGKIEEIYSKAGYDQNDISAHDQLYQSIWDNYNNEKIDAGTRNAYLAEIDKQWGVENPNQGKGGTEEFGLAYIPEDDKRKKK